MAWIDDIKARIGLYVGSQGNQAGLEGLAALLDDIADKANEGGGGGDVVVIKSTADWATISEEGVECSTKAEAATLAGITEDELDFLLNGGDDTPTLFVFGNTGSSEDNHWWTTSGVRRGQQSSSEQGFSMDGGNNPVIYIDGNGKYIVCGFDS